MNEYLEVFGWMFFAFVLLLCAFGVLFGSR